MKLIYILLLFLLILTIRFIIYLPTVQYKEGQKISITHTFFEEPKKASHYQQFIANGLLIHTQRYPEYEYSNSINIEGVVSSLIVSSGEKVLLLENAHVKTVSSPFDLILKLCKNLRTHIISNFTKTLPSSDAGLILGIVFGIRNQIDPELYDAFQKTGVLHVVAASGMNVTLVSQFILILLLVFLKRQIALLLTVALLFVYVVLSGLEPSLIRAACMGGLAFIAQAVGRQHTALLALSVAAFIMLLIDPLLLFAASFQLSFAATVGILYLKPMLDSWVARMKGAILKEDLTTTLSAQISTLPILFSTFGSYPLISLPVNLLILWMIPFLMIVGLIAALLSFIHPMLSTPFLYLAFPLLQLFKAIITFFQPVSLTVRSNSINIFVTLSYYMLLYAIVLYSRKRHKKDIPRADI